MDERVFQPDWFSKPGDTLLALMERHELTSELLAKKLGGATSVVQGLLAGTVAIDAALAVALSRYVGGTAKFWEVRQQKYEQALTRAASAVTDENAKNWISRFPHADMAKNGWINHSRDRDELKKSYLAYFGVNNPAEWEARYADFLKLTAFRTSSTFQSKAGALSAWLRRGEIEAAQIQCRNWNPKAIQDHLNEIRVLSKAKNPAYFLPRLRRLCADAGIAVVFVRSPSACVASGATRFIAPNKAMIILSFRYLTDDHFWFSFFHEVGHLLLHSDTLTFIDGEGPVPGAKEKEANEFAERALIPPARREELSDLLPRREPIIRFAYSLGVSAGVVVGQLQHYGIIKRNQMNFLKRRFLWEQISQAL